jgi:6,7-dimethyl-8-ribityllumazine synthase
MQDSSNKNIILKNAHELRMVIVKSSYHSEITNAMYQDAIQTLKSHGIEKIETIEVSGGYELVYGSQVAIRSFESVSGIITLGCVIKGATDHDVYINQAVANGLIDLQIKTNIPIGFGLLTVNNKEQALERTFGPKGQKGKEVTEAVLQSISLS